MARFSIKSCPTISASAQDRPWKAALSPRNGHPQTPFACHSQASLLHAGSETSNDTPQSGICAFLSTFTTRKEQPSPGKGTERSKWRWWFENGSFGHRCVETDSLSGSRTQSGARPCKPSAIGWRRRARAAEASALTDIHPQSRRSSNGGGDGNSPRESGTGNIEGAFCAASKGTWLELDLQGCGRHGLDAGRRTALRGARGERALAARKASPRPSPQGWFMSSPQGRTWRSKAVERVSRSRLFNARTARLMPCSLLRAQLPGNWNGGSAFATAELVQIQLLLEARYANMVAPMGANHACRTWGDCALAESATWSFDAE